MTYIVAFFAFCVGSIISVICGFGLGVFTMMFLPHVMSSTMSSTAVVSLVSVFLSITICWTLRNKLSFKNIAIPSVTYLLMSTICIYYGKNLPNSSLKLALGVFLIALSLYFIFISKGMKLKPTVKNGLIAGALGGVMSSLFGAGGPAASLYYSSAYEDKEEYLCTIQLYFLVTNIYISIIRAANGIITKEVIITALVGIGGMLVGTLIGKKIFDKINADTMRISIYLLMIVSGIVMIVEALKQF